MSSTQHVPPNPRSFTEGLRLELPVRITEHSWPENTVPLVSIFCITYNHEEFIREAIDGFLMQETTFPVEIFIHDDASTDGTANIVREYADRYPHLFRVILQTENQYSKRGNAAFMPLLESLAGEFIALCEGDDYWTNAAKLQAQVVYLESRKDIVLVTHFTKWIDENGNFLREDWGRSGSRQGEILEYGETDVLEYAFAHPNTWVYRKMPYSDEFKEFLNHMPFGDDFVCFYLLHGGGRAISIGEIWSVYRRHGGGVWSTLTDLKRDVQELVYLVAQKSFYGSAHACRYEELIAAKRGSIAITIYSHLRKRRLKDAWSNYVLLRGFASPYFRPHHEIRLILQQCLFIAKCKLSKRIKKSVLLQKG